MKKAQEYPRMLCREVCRALARQMLRDKMKWTRCRRTRSAEEDIKNITNNIIGCVTSSETDRDKYNEKIKTLNEVLH